MGKKTNMPEQVAIATTTFYNPDSEISNHRTALAKSTIKNAVGLGYEVIIVDGGSSNEFLKAIEKYGARIVQEKGSGMGRSRRQAIEMAQNTGRKIIAWTEPEKMHYISELEKTVVPLLEDRADLVVAKRNSLDSYPTSQRYAENFGNIVWRELTGKPLDMWFGPRTWKRSFSDYFLKYNGAYGDLWDSIFIPVMDLVFDKKRIKSIEVNYTHPRIQSEFEEGNSDFSAKRLDQLNNLIPALKTHWKKLNQNNQH